MKSIIKNDVFGETMEMEVEGKLKDVLKVVKMYKKIRNFDIQSLKEWIGTPVCLTFKIRHNNEELVIGPGTLEGELNIENDMLMYNINKERIYLHIAGEDVIEICDTCVKINFPNFQLEITEEDLKEAKINPMEMIRDADFSFITELF